MANRIFDVVAYLREHGSSPKVVLTTAQKHKLTLKEHPETYDAAGFRDSAAKSSDGVSVSVAPVACEGGAKLKGSDKVYGNSAAGLVEGVCGIAPRKTKESVKVEATNGAAK